MARRRGARNRKDLMASFPAGHWRESEVLGAQGFPTRAPGEPYVVVIHARAGAFVLDGVYRLLEENAPLHGPLVTKALKHHVSTWEGWVPPSELQKPWWAKKLDSSEFTAYWVAE